MQAGHGRHVQTRKKTPKGPEHGKAFRARLAKVRETLRVGKKKKKKKRVEKKKKIFKRKWGEKKKKIIQLNRV
jgi:hypothetical protein